MARPIEKIWVRFGVYMTIVVLLAVGIIAGGLLWNDNQQRSEFYASLPTDVRVEMDGLTAKGLEHSDRADEIYDRYWPKDSPGAGAAIMLALGVSFFLGLAAAVLSARIFVRPIASVAEAALRISQGDLTVRAQSLPDNAELTELVMNFNQMAAALERLEHERRDTIAAISHELRTPLTILQGRLHALCDGVIAASEIEHRRLLDQTEHLVRLVEDLNTLSLLGAGQLSLQCARLDLAVLVRDLLPVYADRAAEYGMQMETDIAPVFVSADSTRLRQIMANLIENSLHYAASGGFLHIRVAQEDNLAVLEVSDRGPGLPHGMAERVFDPFFRVDTSRSRATGGSGLGLSIVKSLIQQHGGNISASNRNGGGAVFKISLPLA
jgi:signal transduction histidine kinase